MGLHRIRKDPTGPSRTQKTRAELQADMESMADELAQADETAIDLYEAQAAQEEINAAQDEALIELYEKIGG